MADLTFNVNVELPAYVIQTYMFSSTNSDIVGYESMPTLTDYVAGALATDTASVGTGGAILQEFATNLGYPNTTVLSAGLYTCHFETQKASGSNNYYCYFELYKRSSGGVETLLATSDNTTQVSINTIVQQTTTATIATNQVMLATDRIVVKIYAVMLSATVNISILYDNNTDSRLELPSVFDFSSIQTQLDAQLGFTLQSASTQVNPGSGTTHSFADTNIATNTTYSSLVRIYVPKACRLKRVAVFAKVGGTLAAGGQLSTFTLVQNGVTDHVVSSSMLLNNTGQLIKNYAFDELFAEDDWFNYKIAYPTWGTAPTSVSYTVTAYFEKA